MLSPQGQRQKCLYQLARQGETVACSAHGHRARSRPDFDSMSFTLTCPVSKGTYIRVLAEDIGRRLGCGAHLTALRRTRVGDLSIDDAVTVETL